MSSARYSSRVFVSKSSYSILLFKDCKTRLERVCIMKAPRMGLPFVPGGTPRTWTVPEGEDRMFDAAIPEIREELVDVLNRCACNDFQHFFARRGSLTSLTLWIFISLSLSPCICHSFSMFFLINDRPYFFESFRFQAC